MAETEVESILREIRERVLSQQRASTSQGTTNGGNGNGEPDPERQMASTENSETLGDENLSLINSYLTTTERAWDRLPPLVSNRSGFSARVELWLKRHLKRATRWYTWEQVNFNAAVHHALRDMLPVLLARESELQKLRARIADVEARRRELEAGLTAKLTEFHADFDGLRRSSDQLEARLAELVNELRERDERLQAEQRVCFKQLALETSEAAVLEDRARRKTEALLEELHHRVGQLEK